MKNKFLMLVISAVLFIGCDKEDNDDNNNEPSAKTTLLVQQTWKFDNAGIDINKDGVSDSPLPAGILQACVTDNTLTFAAGGTGTMNEGTNICANAQQTTPFTWNFLSDETILNVNGSVLAGTSGGQFKIVKLTDTQLSLSKDTSILGTPIALIANLKH
jgi:hypothetical protein